MAKLASYGYRGRAVKRAGAGRRRILIVAADADLRAAMAQIVRAAGYPVELAEGAKRAREIVAEADVAAAVIAATQFGAGAAGLARELRASRRKIILFADAAGKSEETADAPPAGCLRLSAPLDERQLLDCVAQALASPPVEFAAAASAQRLCFAGRTIDLDGRVLLGADGRELPLTRSAFALLLALARNPGRVLSREQLREAVGGEELEPFDRSIDVLVWRLRRRIEPEPKNPRFIVTVPGAGYKFAVPVEKVGAPGDAALAAVPGPSLPDKPSIAVLPFVNLSGDPEQDYFADGMVEEVITALSRIKWLFVIARNSTLTYKGQAIDVKEVGRELGVRYLLEGSVRKAGGRVRIGARLIHATNGAHLWADRFDGSLEDVFELQDRVALSVAGVIEPALQIAETARAASRPTTDLTAYDAYLRATAALPRPTPEIARSVRLLEEAIARDPRYGPALAVAAMCCLRVVGDGFSQDPVADRRKGIDYARRALQVAGDDPVALANAAFALACFGEDIDAMMAVVDRAIAFNPSYARGWFVSAYLRLQAGQPELAIEHARTAQRLSPRGWSGSPPFVIGAALFVSGRFAEAVPHLRLAIENNSSFPVPYQYLAAAYAHLGRVDAARTVVGRLRAVSPQLAPPRPVLRDARHRELLLSGLKLAAGEAGGET